MDATSSLRAWLPRIGSLLAGASLLVGLLSLTACPDNPTTVYQPCDRMASLTSPASVSAALPLPHSQKASSTAASTLNASLSPRQPAVPRSPHTQYQLRFWQRGIIAVGVVASTSSVPTASTIRDTLNPSLAGLNLSVEPSGDFSPALASGSKAETVFFQLKKNGVNNTTANDNDDDDLKSAIDNINSGITPPASGATFAIVGASPDWIMDGGSGGDLVGGHPGGHPTQINGKRTRCQLAGSGQTVYVLDTVHPLGADGKHTADSGVSVGICSSQDEQCPNLVFDLSNAGAGKVVVQDKPSLPNESAYMESYGNSDKSFQEHGLFVSAIIHHIAPSASIHLVRVLNDQGVGDIATLLDTMAAIPEGSIVNLSLGVEPPPSCLIDIWNSVPSGTDYPNYTQSGAIVAGSCNQDPLRNTSDDRLFVPFGIIVADLASRDTIVAAAGNDGNIGAEMPAAICGVKAVAAAAAAAGEPNYLSEGNSAALALVGFSNYPSVLRGGHPGYCLGFATSLSDLQSSKSPVAYENPPVQYGRRDDHNALAADGVNVCSLYTQFPSGTATWSGTSFATAFVSGDLAMNGTGSIVSLPRQPEPCS